MRLRQSIIDQLIQGLSDSARKFLWNETWVFCQRERQADSQDYVLGIMRVQKSEEQAKPIKEIICYTQY